MLRYRYALLIYKAVGNKLKKHRTSNKNTNLFLYIENYRYVCVMNLKIATEIGKCLSNKIRFQILEWLKEPEKHFPPHETLKHFNDGVCVTYIQEKTKLSQSTISTYLTNMEKCGLLISTRHGKWSYLKRNEETIKQFTDFIK